jgi:tetratricopeptide (TPR) repeat protein
MKRNIWKTALLIAAALAILGGGLCTAADKPALKGAETNATALTQAQLDELFAKAVILYKYGRYDEAEAAARQILAQIPDNRDVQQLSEEIARARAMSARTAGQTLGLKKKLDGILIPEVNVREADVRDVVRFLQAESGRLSPDKTPVNFVWLVPADEKLPLVTLLLQKMPLSEVIRYALTAARLNYRVDPHAVVIYKETPQPAPTGSSAPEPNVKSQ